MKQNHAHTRPHCHPLPLGKPVSTRIAHWRASCIARWIEQRWARRGNAQSVGFAGLVYFMRSKARHPPAPVKQKQAQLHVPKCTRHDKLDECIKQTRTPSACHHRRQHHGKNAIMPHRPNRSKNQSPAWALRGVLTAAVHFIFAATSWFRRETEAPSPSRHRYRVRVVCVNKKSMPDKTPCTGFFYFHTPP